MTELNENNTKFTSLNQWVVAALKAKKIGGSPSFSMSGKSIVVFFDRNLRGEWQTARGYGHLPDTVLEGTELDEAKISVGDRVTLQPNKNTLDRSLIGKSGVVTGMVGSNPTVKFANGKTIAVSPKDLKINESVELDEGAVAVSTVEKDIRKNGGTNIKKDDKFIKFMYKGSERKVPVDRGFVKSNQYMKLQDMLEETLREAPEDMEPASPDEKSMAMKQAEFIQYVGKEIGEHLSANKEFPEWMQNKLSALHQKAKDVHSTLGAHGMDESVDVSVSKDFFGIRKSIREARKDSAKDTYFSTYSAAVQYAKAQAEKQGYEVEEDDWFRQVTTGKGKPGSGKTTRHTLQLMKGGKPVRKGLSIQVYNRGTDKNPYELNFYVS